MNEFVILASFQFAIGIYALVRKKYLAKVQKDQSVGKSGPPYDYLNSVSEKVLERSVVVAGLGVIGIGAATLLFATDILAKAHINFVAGHITTASIIPSVLVIVCLFLIKYCRDKELKNKHVMCLSTKVFRDKNGYNDSAARLHQSVLGFGFVFCVGIAGAFIIALLQQ